MAAALILTADELITDWLFGGEPLTCEDMSAFLKSSEMVSTERRGYEYLLDWVNINYTRFNKPDKSITDGDIYGKIENNIAYIIYPVYSKACYNAGFNPDALRKYLRDKNLLDLRGDGKTAVFKTVSHGASASKCIALKLPYTSDY